MTSRDLPDRTDEFDALARDARDELGDAISLELRDVAPDFAAVVEAAHARDPQRVSRAMLTEALELAPVVMLSSDSSQRLTARGHAELGALLVEARDEVDAELAALRRKGWPPVPVPKASTPRRNGVAWLSLAAAAVLIAVASPMLATRFEAARDSNQAPWWQRASETTREAVWREAVTPEPPRPAREPPAPHESPALEAIEPEPEAPATTVEPPEQPVPKVRKPATTVEPPAETLAARLRRLGAEAEQAWQSGDPAGAERRHREIIALAPGSRAADLSYGDLFTLARQRSAPEQEISLWREYLTAFPRGRYADDARAGLCRRAATDERAACWQQYLTDFPAGVHRAQATRARGEATP